MPDIFLVKLSSDTTLFYILQVLDVEHAKYIDYPSNGVSVSGFLRPTFVDEEYYIRRLFSNGDSVDLPSDCKGNGIT